MNLLKLVYVQRIDPLLGRTGNGEIVELSRVPFLIPKDRVRNLEQQRKEKRKKRERERERDEEPRKLVWTKYVHTRCGRSSGFVATNRSNHLSMQPSLAIRLTDAELPRFRYTLQLPSAVRCVFYSFDGERGLPKIRPFLSHCHSSRRSSNRGVKFVINCQVSGAG